MMINVKRNTKFVVNVTTATVTATKRKNIIMIGVENMTTLVTNIMISIEMMTIIKSVVRRNSVIAVTDITKTKSPPSEGFV
ncbi:hypothetical protein ACFQ4N_09360 [Oceanobacillus iheyensis]|uniref:hypothetical protein n=1 Tax=Oceanobacillus iheyensis TaxID=182710 RepID=UPI00363CA097